MNENICPICKSKTMYWAHDVNHCDNHIGEHLFFTATMKWFFTFISVYGKKFYYRINLLENISVLYPEECYDEHEYIIFNPAQILTKEQIENKIRMLINFS